MARTKSGHPLYRAAQAADLRFSRACRLASGGRRNRYELRADEQQHPAVRAAYQRKRTADDAWLSHMRGGAK